MPRPRSRRRAPPGRPGPRIRIAYRIEALRRFANVVRRQGSRIRRADLARRPASRFWEAKTEVGAVVNKVEISIEAYAERTPQRKMEAALGNRIAVRHKPHGVLAVLGPVQFPRAPAQRPHRPGADRRQCGRLQAVREDARRRASSSSAASTKREFPKASSGC